jgi:large subunit ribosomal protein L17
MKKRIAGIKLSRGQGARKALKRSMISALLQHGSIKTTKKKAQFIQSEIDKLITLAKKGDVAGRRMVYSKTGNNRNSTELLVNKVAANLNDRKSGYTRIIPLPERRGDKAPVVKIEWVKNLEIDKKENISKKDIKKTEKKETKKPGLASRLLKKDSKTKSSKTVSK